MIAYVTGTVAHKEEQSVTLSVGPMGVTLAVPTSRDYHVGGAATLYTYMHWNQEQGPSFFGFPSETERQVFLLIISCQGIGPRIALAVLADLGAQRFLEAVHMAEDRTLSKVSGIGAKKAEHIIVQLKHKVAQLVSSGALASSAAHLTEWNTVTQALESLNYSRQEINRVMTHLKSNASDQKQTFDQLMRQALSFLAKQS